MKKNAFTQISRVINFVFFLILLFSIEGIAGVFTIKNRTYGNVTDQALIQQIDTAFNTLETQVNSQLTNFSTTDYLKGVANSAPIAASGTTEDHDQRFNLFYLGLSGGIAADFGSTSPSSLISGDADLNSFKGMNGALNFTIGLPLWVLLVKVPGLSMSKIGPTKLYISTLSQDYSQDDFSFKFKTYSLILQHHFFSQKSYALGMLKWRGLSVSTGFKYSQIDALFTKNFSESTQQVISAPPLTPDPTLTLNFSNQVSLGAKTTITSIPIEASTAVSLFYLFNLHFGLGADINTGSSQSIIQAPGQVTGTETSGLLGTFSGDIDFDLGDKATPQVMDARYFLGGSLDFRILSLGLQYTKAMTNNAQGVSFQLAAHF